VLDAGEVIGAEVGEGVEGEVTDFERFLIGDVRGSGDRAAAERGDDVLCEVAAGMTDDAGEVDAGDAFWLDVKAGFFEDFADDGGGGVFAGIEHAADDSPFAGIGTAAEEYFSGVVEDETADARDEEEFTADARAEVFDVVGEGHGKLASAKKAPDSHPGLVRVSRF
jgi:hypothetical protein